MNNFALFPHYIQIFQHISSKCGSYPMIEPRLSTVYLHFCTPLGKRRLAFSTSLPPHWRRKWQPTPVFLPGECHGQTNLAGYSPWGCKESDMTERLTHTHTHTHTHTASSHALASASLDSSFPLCNTVSPLHSNLHIANFQRCEHAFICSIM